MITLNISVQKEDLTADALFAKAMLIAGKDELDANVYLRKAAKLGSADASFELARRYAQGIPMRDMAEAERFFQQADGLGSVKAKYVLYLLRNLSFEDDPVEINFAEAIQRCDEVVGFHPTDQLRLLSGTETPYIYEDDDVFLLKDLAAVGDVLAAFLLYMGYAGRDFNVAFEEEPLECFRWELISQYLWGYPDWIERTLQPEGMEESDRDTIVTEVNAWIDRHPLARQAAVTENYRRRFTEAGGNVLHEDL